VRIDTLHAPEAFSAALVQGGDAANNVSIGKAD